MMLKKYNCDLSEVHSYNWIEKFGQDTEYPWRKKSRLNPYVVAKDYYFYNNNFKNKSNILLDIRYLNECKKPRGACFFYE
jgi:hypothetical protein